ncbi:hypothetical protein B0537_00940 [Desulforamulus ferrireducens]|uniref:Uncharacterized protein n=1 Tax=Desulforamulus ferrireducens TaxID=1833852 RepID=A0A1S6ISQ6_9FIRM|nr:hypothetical protein B0537_00940 [Desulforamulus ferrireducens]
MGLSFDLYTWVENYFLALLINRLAFKFRGCLLLIIGHIKNVYLNGNNSQQAFCNISYGTHVFIVGKEFKEVRY